MNDADYTTERWAGNVLRAGVWISAALLCVGLFLSPPGAALHVAGTNPSLAAIVRDLFSGHATGDTFIFAGLVTLMLTPFLRVAAAFVGFTVERDKRFMLTSAIVLFLLLGELVYSLR